MASTFSGIEPGKPIKVFELTAAFKEDQDEKKVNLGIGAYRTDEGVPWVLPVVRTVETQMAADKTLNKEYLPICGLASFTAAAAKLVLGEGSPVLIQNKYCCCQTISGTGACYLSLLFYRKIMKLTNVLVSKPTWPNHTNIAKEQGYNVGEYRYWNPETRGIDIEGMLQDLENAEEGTLVILHATAHNPTGVDATKEQWIEICNVVKKRNHRILFDIAYQGFATGDLEEDAWAVRYFISQGVEMMIAQSFAKNFGLYCERIGNLCVVNNDSSLNHKILSQLAYLVRVTWSNPPAHGARIVSTVLNTPALFSEWKSNVWEMAERIRSMRRLLKNKLSEMGTPGNWDHIIQQVGMFCYTGLTAKHVAHMKKKFHIYLLDDGRINVCGVTSKNVDWVAEAINDAVTTVTA